MVIHFPTGNLGMQVQLNTGRIDSQHSGTTFRRPSDPSTVWMLCEPGGGVPWSLTPDTRGAVNLSTGGVTELPNDEIVEFVPFKAVPVS